MEATLKTTQRVNKYCNGPEKTLLTSGNLKLQLSLVTKESETEK